MSVFLPILCSLCMCACCVCISFLLWLPASLPAHLVSSFFMKGQSGEYMPYPSRLLTNTHSFVHLHQDCVLVTKQDRWGEKKEEGIERCVFTLAAVVLCVCVCVKPCDQKPLKKKGSFQCISLCCLASFWQTHFQPRSRSCDIAPI